MLCRATPHQPPARSTGRQAPSRLPELEAVEVPVLVVQGARDPFGMPSEGPGRTVVQVTGDHSLRCDLPGARVAIEHWLRAVTAAPG